MLLNLPKTQVKRQAAGSSPVDDEEFESLTDCSVQPGWYRQDPRSRGQGSHMCVRVRDLELGGLSRDRSRSLLKDRFLYPTAKDWTTDTVRNTNSC